MTSSHKRQLLIDLETASGTSLPDCGVYRYAADPDFTILLIAYAFDDEPVELVDVACGEDVPQEFLDALSDPEILKLAYNANFERTCMGRFFNRPMPPEQWQDIMIHAAYLGLPRSLAGVCDALGLGEDQGKMKEGKDLIRYFCLPCKPTKTNGGRTRNLPSHAPDKWEIFRQYCIRDVESERTVERRLSSHPVPESEWEIWRLDQAINDRGVMIDTRLARMAVAMSEANNKQLTEEAARLTGLENPSSVAQLKRWLDENDEKKCDSLSKAYVSDRLKELPEGTVKRVLTIRKETGKSSVSKYEAMLRSVCEDGRIHGMFQHYGAQRTGRFSSKLIQLQNLPQNHIEDLDIARNLVRDGDLEFVRLCYGDVNDTLSQLIRTAVIPKDGCLFAVSDFSAIEARLLAWLAGEQWKMDVFANGGDIYCETASQMFGVPVEKHGQNAELRQKGKVATLACIAEGSLVLTSRGMTPIEQVTRDMQVWDGENWVSHDGVIYKGEREVITYAGLTATPDHLVWVVGKGRPVPFGEAAASGARLVLSGIGGMPVRVGKNYQPGETLEQEMELLLRADGVHELRKAAMDAAGQSQAREIQGLPAVLQTEDSTEVAGTPDDCREAAVHQSERPRIPELWREGDPIPLQQPDGRSAVAHGEPRATRGSDAGDRSDRYERGLRAGESALRRPESQPGEPEEHGADGVRPAVLALRTKRSNPEALRGAIPGGDHRGSQNGGSGEAEGLAKHRRTVRVYDIRNAGPNHRYTVSGRLVHNCGYGGGVGAMINMGAVRSGIPEEELPDIINRWRDSSPRTVELWHRIDSAAMAATKYHEWSEDLGYGLRIGYEDGLMIIELPSGRRLHYVKPRIGTNRFGREAVTYMGGTGWTRIETFGGKLTENVIQAIGRDCLAWAMLRVSERYPIVMHVHDEMIAEVPLEEANGALKYMNEVMAEPIPWAPGLILKGDGDVLNYYRK